ncbi:EAL domain-containing protein [Eubacterium aggregans]|uniref:EAL domain-containing protein n=1 Tax=Eubacterium aggregans TaxID=81409 RepID=UPI0023F25D2E|nr:EAL domain-containing protein [Eubacterium aggregans]MDD4691664.1 EAL domain-containing protein [Eubacterium aggregans]
MMREKTITLHNMHLMINRLINDDYMFLGQIETATGVVTLYSDDTKFHFKKDDFIQMNYDELLSVVFKDIIQDSHYDEAIQALCRETIISQLSIQDPYLVSFPVKTQEGVKSGYFQWKCTYLTADKAIILIASTDITEAVAQEYDLLTGLLNRSGFYRHARQLLDSNPQCPYQLIRIDLDNFKILNDTLGVEKGDTLLRDCGTFFRSLRDDRTLFAHLDSDHFVCLLPQNALSNEAFYNRIEGWFSSYPLTFQLSSHIGVYLIESRDIDISIMCDRALLALKSIKGSYTQRIAQYDKSLRDQIMEEQALSGEMVPALAQGQFEVYLQPQINYENGALIGAEALVRWNHPQRGLLPPAVFIPLFERNGFITALDKYVWEQCCRTLRRWLDDTNKYVPIAVSVNISRIDIYNPHLCDYLIALVDGYQLPHTMLKLEITESAYMQNPEHLMTVVQTLRDAGFLIEMDDFGSGYSSLNTLKDVPVDLLKLDLKFLSSGQNDVRGGNILSSVIRMAHWLKIPVIAEGVETQDQADYLKSLGCLYMQGYYFDKPMPIDTFESLLVLRPIDRTNRYKTTNLRGIAAFWDPSAQNTLLFNSFVGGAAILEYQNGNAEILRANDRFYQELHTTREAYLYKQQHLLERFEPIHRTRYENMLKEAIKTGKEAECEVEHRPLSPDTSGQWTCNRSRLLSQNGDTAILYITVENITKRKQIEAQLEMSQEALHLSISKMGKYICYFDIATRTLIMPEHYAKKHGVPVVQKNIPYDSVSILAQDRLKYHAFYERILRGEEAGHVVFRAANTDGTYSWEQVDFATQFSEGGVPLQAIIVVQDISEQVAEVLRMQ